MFLYMSKQKTKLINIYPYSLSFQLDIALTVSHLELESTCHAGGAMIQIKQHQPRKTEMFTFPFNSLLMLILTQKVSPFLH